MGVNLSVIIPSYNTNELTERCLSTLIKSLPKSKNFISEVIIVDNGSTDGSLENIKYQIANRKNKYKNLKITFNIIQNKKNLGYPKANNQGIKIAGGKYILFLNSDTILDNINFEKLLNYFESHPEVGVVTIKVILSNGSIDPASHRGFPNIWNSFCYFAGLEDVFKHVPFFNKIFGGYHLTHLNIEKIHEIDSPAGAFYLTRSNILKKIGGFDESFFMYGEDLDLSFRVKEFGYKIVYYPHYRVTHLKHASGLEKFDLNTRKETKYHFFDAMKIFYRKHYEKIYPPIINGLIYLVLDIIRNRYVQNRNRR